MVCSADLDLDASEVEEWGRWIRGCSAVDSYAKVCQEHQELISQQCYSTEEQDSDDESDDESVSYMSDCMSDCEDLDREVNLQACCTHKQRTRDTF